MGFTNRGKQKMKLSTLNKAINPTHKLTDKIVLYTKYIAVYDCFEDMYVKHLLNNDETADFDMFIGTDKYYGGRCNYTKKIITISKYLIENNNLNVIKNVMLHEIAHCLTRGHKHRDEFIKVAKKIGCEDKFTTPYSDYYTGNERDEIIRRKNREMFRM